MVRYLSAERPTLQDYLRLDDASVWSLVHALAEGPDERLARLARRLLERRLFKVFDVSARAGLEGSAVGDFLYRLQSEAPKLGLEWERTLIVDRPRQTGYDWYEWDSPSALKKVFVQSMERNENIDIGASPLVEALVKRSFIRVYVPEREDLLKIEKLWKTRR